MDCCLFDFSFASNSVIVYDDFAATLLGGCPFNVAIQTTIVCQNKLSDNTVKKSFSYLPVLS